MSGSKKPDNNKDNNKDKEEATLQQADDEINEFLRSRDSLSPAVKEYLRSSLQRNRVHPSRTPTPRPPSGNLPELEEFSSEPPAAKVPEAKKSNRGKKRKKPEGGRRKRKSRRSRRKRRTKRRKRKRRNSTRRKKRS